MVKLYIRQKVFKITDHYPVFDENREAVYYVDQDFKFIGNTVHVSNRDQKEIFTINKVILTFLPRYTIDYLDGRHIEINEKFAFFKKKFDINSSEYDLKVEGDFLSLNFNIYNKDILIGQVNKAWLSWGDCFELTIYDESFCDVVLGLTIAVDDILDEESKKN